MIPTDQLIPTELVDVGSLSLDELLRRDPAELDGSVRRILLQVDLPEPLTASKQGEKC
ncbi:MAG TPA: hypothetical protein VLH10_07495 [Yinghuangia sp.]|uniref:hypothetical protein n=1 Tax=Yinghuangia sp. YIM S10712 TaxID=3436930 RepID=UPI002B51E9A1|nr:hypothetical protein [Yinghuangia sp.]